VLCVASSLVMTAPVGGARGSELRDDFEHVADFDAILGAAEPTFGERYGGAFIDRSVNPAVLRVTVVDATFADAERLARISRSNPRVQLGSAEHSKAVLDRAARAIEAVLTDELDGRYWGVGVDERSSRIDVSAKQLSDRLRMRLDALAPADAIAYDLSSDNGFTLLAGCRNCRAARALAMTPHRAVDLRTGFFGLTRVARLAHHRVVDASGAAGHGLGVGDARYCGSGRQVGLSPDRRSAAWQSRIGRSPAVIVQDLQSGRRQVLRRACRPAWSRDGRLAFIRSSGHFKAYAGQPAGVLCVRDRDGHVTRWSARSHWGQIAWAGARLIVDGGRLVAFDAPGRARVLRRRPTRLAAVSPDGSRLLINAPLPGTSTAELKLISVADGRTLSVARVDNGQTTVSDAAWTGSHIVGVAGSEPGGATHPRTALVAMHVTPDRLHVDRVLDLRDSGMYLFDGAYQATFQTPILLADSTDRILVGLTGVGPWHKTLLCEPSLGRCLARPFAGDLLR